MKLSNKNGHTSILQLCPHMRWALAPDTPHSMTAGVVGIGKKSWDLVSPTSHLTDPTPPIDPLMLASRITAPGQPFEGG